MRLSLPIAATLLLMVAAAAQPAPRVASSEMPTAARPAAKAAPARPVPKPPAAPKPEASGPTSQPSAGAGNSPKAPTSAAAPVAGQQPTHYLIGDWNVYWMAENRTSKMKVLQAQTINGVTSFSGALATAYGEACTFSGNVLDNFSGQFAEGSETKTLDVSAFVLMKALCDHGQIWIEAFGLPAGKALISGRATFLASDGHRSYLAIAMGR